MSENLSTQNQGLSTGGIVTPFAILQNEWVMLAPLGDHPHALGIQRFTPAFIQNMANRFNGFFARMGRLFSGAPTFEGHHDIEPDKYPNSRSYGWIMALEARTDGLWGKMTWTPEGREMLQNGAFKFVSPVFLGKPIGHENGKTIFEPIAFKSLALTNEPNLPLPPLANEKDPMTTITELLDLPNEASAEDILQAVTRLKNAKPPLVAPELQAQADRATSLEAELATLQNTLVTRTSDLATTQARLIAMILDNSIRDGRITLAQRDEWKTKLEADLTAAETALANQAPALNTTSQTRELGNQKEIFANEATRRSELLAFISEKQAAGMDYDAAWALAKKERAALFEQMTRNKDNRD